MNLKMRRAREILAECLEWAEKEGPSYAGFLPEGLQTQQVRFLQSRIRRARLPDKWAPLPGVGVHQTCPDSARPAPSIARP